MSYAGIIYNAQSGVIGSKGPEREGITKCEVGFGLGWQFL
jgi:hypothetical protein